MRISPKTLVANCARMRSMGTVSIAPDWLYPALLTRMPTAPSAFSTASTADRIDSSSVTSSASVSHPRSPSSAIDSALRAVAYTLQPRAARRSAVARPIPDEQPVIRTARETSAMGRTLSCGALRAVTFQEPGEVRVEERPDPEPAAPDDAVVRVEATGICGSDLHIYHGRVAIEPGFVIGHEYVGTVVAIGDSVSEVAVGDRVLGTYCTACGRCFHC